MNTKATINDIHRFDQWSQTYEDSWFQKSLLDRVHQAVLDIVAKATTPQSILDVGCGTGRLLRKAQNRWPNAQLLGVDPAEGMVKVARQLTPTATFQIGMAETLPLPDASVDVVLSTASFHHWHDQQAGMREIARVLRPTGLFFLADASAPAWLSRFIRHARFPSPAQRRSLFTAARLSVLVQKPVFSRFVIVTVGMR